MEVAGVWIHAVDPSWLESYIPLLQVLEDLRRPAVLGLLPPPHVVFDAGIPKDPVKPIPARRRACTLWHHFEHCRALALSCK